MMEFIFQSIRTCLSYFLHPLSEVLELELLFGLLAILRFVFPEAHDFKNIFSSIFLIICLIFLIFFCYFRLGASLAIFFVLLASAQQIETPPDKRLYLLKNFSWLVKTLINKLADIVEPLYFQGTAMISDVPEKVN